MPMRCRRLWPAVRDYRVCEVVASLIPTDLAAVLDGLAREFALEEL